MIKTSFGNLYSFDELSPEIQKKVIDKNRYININIEKCWQTVKLDFLYQIWISDDKVIETIKYNEFLFYEDGTQA